MVGWGHVSGMAGWKAQKNPLSYGGIPRGKFKIMQFKLNWTW